MNWKKNLTINSQNKYNVELIYGEKEQDGSTNNVGYVVTVKVTKGGK